MDFSNVRTHDEREAFLRGWMDALSDNKRSGFQKATLDAALASDNSESRAWGFGYAQAMGEVAFADAQKRKLIRQWIVALVVIGVFLFAFFH